MVRGSWLALIAAALLASGGIAPDLAGPAQAAAQQLQSGLEPLTIVTSSGPHKFLVEVMRTDEQRARGLMYRRFMPQDRGMLFDFERSEPVAMWMKNTYLPLDMVFMDKSGRVTHLALNAEPLSERIIPSNGPAYAVLELNAGVARAIGLKKGDRVETALFGD
jgi:uncharacterized membrane protein (UPF0127 family)